MNDTKSTSGGQEGHRLAEAVAYAARLGPGSLACLRACEADGRLEVLLGGRRSVEDVVLGVVHAGMGESRALAGEFLGEVESDVQTAAMLLLSGRHLRTVSASDLAQEVTLSICTASTGGFEFRTRAEFMAWVRRSLKNRLHSIERYRMAGKRRDDLRVSHSAAAELADDLRSPLSVLSARDDARSLARAVLRLGERDRQMIELHLEGRSAAEIAARLEYAVPSVHKRLATLRERLAQTTGEAV